MLLICMSGDRILQDNVGIANVYAFSNLFNLLQPKTILLKKKKKKKFETNISLGGSFPFDSWWVKKPPFWIAESNYGLLIERSCSIRLLAGSLELIIIRSLELIIIRSGWFIRYEKLQLVQISRFMDFFFLQKESFNTFLK